MKKLTQWALFVTGVPTLSFFITIMLRPEIVRKEVLAQPVLAWMLLISLIGFLISLLMFFSQESKKRRTA